MKKIMMMMVAALTALSFAMVAGATEQKKEGAKPAASKKADKKSTKKDAEKKPAKQNKQLSGC